MDPTDEQRAVIEAQEGTTLVLAAVGSGKTSTLAARLARAVEGGADPARILALTFTNRAAIHMRAGLEAAAPQAAPKVSLSTFHALCTRILRAEAERVGLPPDFRVMDEEDSAELLRELGVPRQVAALYDLHAEAAAVPLGQATVELWNSGAFSQQRFAPRYVAALGEQGAVDFAGLVLLARALLLHDPAARARWGHRFDVVLVDEVQDTHLSEYEVLRELCRNARSRCLVGDLDQTIYGWRGSDPEALLARLALDLPPVRRLSLTRCFRATRALLLAADRLATQMSGRATRVDPHPSVPAGEPPLILAFDTLGEEEEALADRCAARIAAGVPGERIAILIRNNAQVPPISDALTARGVPHGTVEQLRFFRRQEVKDALALASLVWDRHDEPSARRVARRLVEGVGPATLKSIFEEGRACGLRLGDLLDPAALATGDPLSGLFTAEVVVLDTETTGFDPLEDEIVEVAAVRIRDGVEVDRFEALIRPTRPVGVSERVHRISDARLAAEGRPAAEVLGALAAFIGATPIAGHNIGYDLGMLVGHGARAGVAFSLAVAWDSLPLARRLISAEGYTLGGLVASLGLEAEATHRAMDDVQATVRLGAVLARKAGAQILLRKRLMAEHGPKLARLRATLDRWSEGDARPAAMIRRIVDEALRFKIREPDRLQSLEILIRRLGPLDTTELPPREAMRSVLERAALQRDSDALDQTPGVRVITIHQAKGLEFDEVFVPALVEGTLPSWRVEKFGKPEELEEERRLLYVAITRARSRLVLSWHTHDRWGRSTRPSRFLAELAPRDP